MWLTPLEVESPLVDPPPQSVPRTEVTQTQCLPATTSLELLLSLPLVVPTLLLTRVRIPGLRPNRPKILLLCLNTPTVHYSRRLLGTPRMVVLLTRVTVRLIIFEKARTGIAPEPPVVLTVVLVVLTILLFPRVDTLIIP